MKPRMQSTKESFVVTSGAPGPGAAIRYGTSERSSDHAETILTILLGSASWHEGIENQITLER